MDRIAQEIPTIHVVDVNVVGVEPPQRPRVNRREPVTTVLKTSRPAGEIGAVHVKRVATAEAGAIAIVRNAPMTCSGLRRPRLLLRWLGLLLSVLRLRRRFGLLRRGLSLLLSMLLFRRFGLLLSVLRLRRLGLLWRRLSLLLSVLRLRRRFGLLWRRLSLLLSVLRLLCRFGLLWSRLSLLLLLLRLFLRLVWFLRIGGNHGSGKQEQHCGTENLNYFH